MSKRKWANEIFDREKLVRSMIIATRKRNISEEKIDLSVNGIVVETRKQW